MLFNSLAFIFFLCIVVFSYFMFPTKKRWIVLLLASIVFYAIAGIKFIPYILVTSIVSFTAAYMIMKKYEWLDEKLKEENNRENIKELKETCKKECRRIVIISLVITIGILCYTKFTSMFVDSLQKLMNHFGIQTLSKDRVSIIVPLGISYYTFSTVGYVLDVYWKRYKAEKNFAKYFLYVIYFPHILQGPIARYNRLSVQLYEEHKFDYQRVCYGVQLMLWGYFKKLVIADRLVIFVNSVYGNWQEEKGFILLIATILYSLYFYADFSGCVDMARGMSQIFGISLDDNFKQPYFSQSVAEFWRRWHITLGTWFKDYLYMPVSVSGTVKKVSKGIKKKYGNQAGKNAIMIMSLSVVWLATGIWHGTGWTYVIWGIWHGSLIIGSSLLENTFLVWKNKLVIDENTVSWKLFRIVRTFTLTAIIPRILTRAGSVTAAIGVFKNIFSEFNIWVFFDKSLYSYGLNQQNFWLAIFAVIVLFAVDYMKEKGIEIRESIAKRNIIIRWLIYYVAIFSIIVFGIYGSGYDASSFIYMQF